MTSLRSPRWHRAAPLALASMLASCGLPGTGGEVVAVEWSFRADVPAGPVIVETVGENPWEVELLEARLILGPAYAFAPDRADRPGLAWLLGPSRAHAHAGDDNSAGSRVLCELLDQVAVDLLDPTTRSMQPTFAGAGPVVTLAEAGPVDRMNIVLDEARYELAAADGPTGGGHALLRGVARRTQDGALQELPFRAVLTGATIPDDRIARRVEALPTTGELVEGARVEIVADPRPWVRQMDFDRLQGEATNDAFEVEVAEPSQLHNAWYLGLRDPAGWQVRIEAPRQTR